MEGGENGLTDQVYILIDNDADPETGYYYEGLGADYMIHSCGLAGDAVQNDIFTFPPSADNNNDWNSWTLVNTGNIATGRNKLEATIHKVQQTNNDNDVAYAIFETYDHTGFSDKSDIVSNLPGYLVVDYSPAVTDPVIQSSINTQTLKLTATAHERPITLESLTFENLADNNVISTSPELPINLKAGKSTDILVSVDTTTLRLSSVFKLELQDVSAFTNIKEKRIGS
jgi:hypothetical protein